MSVKYVVQSTDKNWRNLAISSLVIGLVSTLIIVLFWILILSIQCPIEIVFCYTYFLMPLFVSSIVFGLIALIKKVELKFRKTSICGIIFSSIAFILSIIQLIYTVKEFM